jgi:hypothetical protein
VGFTNGQFEAVLISLAVAVTASFFFIVLWFHARE